ncbi:MAG: SMC-Scp complex subunit ScpB [Patescibacteria group bacterium]
MNLSAKIEAILFFKSEPIEKTWLAKTFSVSVEAIDQALAQLKTNLTDRGLTLLEKGTAVMLGTNPELSDLIEGLIKEELNRDLGKAGLETLAIVLYEGPLSRAEIDYIRGVNSSFILRNLLVRGLVERLPKPGDARTFLYGPTFELLRFLGVSQVPDLPDYANIRQELLAFKEQVEADNNGEPGNN